MRTRSAKKLAQRINLYYFKTPGPLRRWRTILSIAIPLAALAWLGALAAAGNRHAYSSGPLARPHAFVEGKCEVCHVRDANFRAHVPADACLACHDAPAHREGRQPARQESAVSAHHESRTPARPEGGAPAPACSACHVEHEGSARLAAVADDLCVRCHAGSSKARVTGFPSGHPAFAAARPGAKDAGTIRFNHAVHLKPDLRGPAGTETLACAGCHLPAAGPAAGAPRKVRETMGQSAPSGGRAMSPVTYTDQCARCHPLFFDERIDAQAPHDEPAAVRAFVDRSLRAYIERYPDALHQPDPAPRRVPLNFPRPDEPPARSAAEWLARRSVRAQTLLWQRTCPYCHEVTQARDGLSAAGAQGDPVVARAGMRARWMPAADFDHGTHQMMECASCHGARDSRSTSDVLMPAAATCAPCHAPDRGAGASCATCHAYHDWSAARPVTGRFRASDFR